MLDAAPDAIVGVEGDGRIAFLNIQAESLFGYSRDELAGLPIETVVPDAGRDLQLMATNPALVGRRKDGSTFGVEISVGRIEVDGVLVQLVVVRDSTERRRAEAMFRGLLEAAPDAIIGVRADGTIALANAQTSRLFGYSREELIGEPLELLIPEEARSVHPEHQAGYFRNPVTRPMGAGRQLSAKRRDGSTFPAEISLSAIDTDEGRLVSAAVRDITDRVELENERRGQALEAQRQQMHRLESLGQLAGGVAHDFNNLLGVILNYAEFVARRVADDETARADVEEIRRAAERAAQLTHQLLAFGRREVVQPEILDVNDVLSDVERLLQRTLGEHVELLTATDPGLAPVMVDRGRLEQVLVNLAVNARDAMGAGGKLRVDTSNVTFAPADAEQLVGLEPGSYVQLRVSDTGVGMDRETLRRAFEPFFTTKPQGEGTGLGLATVYGIVQQAGGTVHLYSEPGAGTTVTVYLPVVEGTPLAGTRARAAVAPGGNESILLVEDEDAFREMARRILTGHGYRVTATTGGIEALEVFEQSPESVDLLLTDVVMPGMSGPDLIERVRAVRSDLPAVLMSGYAAPILAAGAMPDSTPLILEKPFNSDQLLRRVREALDEKDRT